MRPSKGKSEATILERIAKPVAISSLFGILIAAGFLFIFSIVLSKSSIPHSLIDPMALVAACIGSLIAGYLCAKMLREKGMLFGLICGGLIALVLLLSGMVLGTLEFGVRFFVKIGAVLIASGIGGILGVNARSKRK